MEFAATQSPPPTQAGVAPMLRLSARAIRPLFASTRSAKQMMILARAAGDKPLHTPLSKAPRAARTARSTSRSSPLGTLAKTSPVPGSVSEEVLPPMASTCSPLMNIL